MSKVNTSIAAAMPVGRVARRLRIGLLAATALTIGSIGFVNSYNTVAVRAETAGAEVVTPFGRAPLSFADVIEKVSGSVVSIYVTNGGNQPFSSSGPDLFPDLPDDHPLKDFFKKFGKGGPNQPGPQAQPSLAQGSGFVISADGYVVTNNHVVADASKVEISFDEQIKLPADVIGKDARTDLALLKIKSDKSFPFVPFAEKKVRVGDWVIAIGNPFGLGGTVTAGIVSAASRDIGSGPYDYLQIDAAVNRGNSGGPAFNLDGEVIGVNSAIFSPSGGNVGIAFAIPADLARQVVDQLKASGSVSRGWLGVHIQNVSDEIAQSFGMDRAHGALITKITEDGPSAKSSLEVGDAVVEVNGEEVVNSRDLARKVADLSPDTDAKLKVMRDGKSLDLVVKLGSFPGNAEVASLNPDEKPQPSTGERIDDFGMSLSPASAAGKPDLKDGVIVMKVEPNSEAADKGLQVGDVIIEVAGEVVQNPADVTKGVDGAKSRGRKAVLFRIKSGDAERFVALTLKAS